MSDVVNHPSHYTDGKYEVIDFIEDRQFGYCMGNVIKYISRAGKKDPTKEIEDLKKARWYLERRMNQIHPFIRNDKSDNLYDCYEDTSPGYIYMNDYVNDKGINGCLRECMYTIDIYCKLDKSSREKYFLLEKAMTLLEKHIQMVKEVVR